MNRLSGEPKTGLIGGQSFELADRRASRWVRGCQVDRARVEHLLTLEDSSVGGVRVRTTARRPLAASRASRRTQAASRAAGDQLVRLVFSPTATSTRDLIPGHNQDPSGPLSGMAPNSNVALCRSCMPDTGMLGARQVSRELGTGRHRDRREKPILPRGDVVLLSRADHESPSTQWPKPNSNATVIVAHAAPTDSASRRLLNRHRRCSRRIFRRGVPAACRSR